MSFGKGTLTNQSNNLSNMSCAPTTVDTHDKETHYDTSDYQSSLKPIPLHHEYLSQPESNNIKTIYKPNSNSVRKRSFNYEQDEYNRIPTLTKEPSSFISTLFEKIFKRKRRKTSNIPLEFENGRITHSLVRESSFLTDPIDTCNNSYLVHPIDYNGSCIPNKLDFQSQPGTSYMNLDYNPHIPNQNQIYNLSTCLPAPLHILTERHKGPDFINNNISAIPNEFSPYRNDPENELNEHKSYSDLSPTLLNLKKEICSIPVASLGGLDLDNSIELINNCFEGNSNSSIDSNISIEASPKSSSIKSRSDHLLSSEKLHQTSKKSHCSENSNSEKSPDTIKELLSPKSQLWYWYQDFNAENENESHYSNAENEKESHYSDAVSDYEQTANNLIENLPESEDQILKITEKQNTIDQFYEIKAELIKKLRNLNHLDSVPNYSWHASRILTSTDSLLFSAYKVIFEGFDINSQSNEHLRNISKELEGLYFQYN